MHGGEPGFFFRSDQWSHLCNFEVHEVAVDFFLYREFCKPVRNICLLNIVIVALCSISHSFRNEYSSCRAERALYVK